MKYIFISIFHSPRHVYRANKNLKLPVHRQNEINEECNTNAIHKFTNSRLVVSRHEYDTFLCLHIQLQSKNFKLIEKKI